MNAQQLKNSILQEAIEGRLVPQDPNDEPASVLLDKIRAEKKRLVKEGKLKKKDLEETPVEKEEAPFDLPKSWKWIRFGDLVSTSTGKTPARGEAEYWCNNDFPWVSISDMKQGEVVNNTKEFISEKAANDCFHNEISKRGTLIMSFKLTVGRTSILGMDAYHNEAIISIKTYADKNNNTRDYLAYILPIIANSGDSKDAIKGKTLNSTSIYNLLVPLPPLAEQKRIVAKIEELLPKVEEYGKAQESLDKLNEELPDRLKKSILQEAIEGRLVPQDPNDEPASVLLDKIRAEKKRLVKEGILKKKDLEESPISEDEITFKIPNNWQYIRLGDITYNHGQKTPENDFSYIDIGSIDNKHQKLNNEENIIKAKDAPSRARKIVGKGDVIYATVRPYLHNICIIDKDFTKEPIASTGFAVLSCIKGVYNKFLFYFLISPNFDAYANDGDNAKGMAYPAINDKKLYNGVVPLPPLAEQKRIVEKIEQLFHEIDKLKVG